MPHLKMSRSVMGTRIAFASELHWWTYIKVQAVFQFDVLVCTAQTNKSMKTNDIPLKSPIKLQQEMQKKF